MTEQFYEKLREISKFLEREGDGISYISNKPDAYTIGTRKYSERLWSTWIKTWKPGKAANPNSKKRRVKVNRKRK